MRYKLFSCLGVCLILTISSLSVLHEKMSKADVENLIPLPLVKQSTEYTCGAAAVLSILKYFGDETLEAELVKQLGTNSNYGTDYRQMVQFFQSKGFQITAHAGMSMSELQEHISQGKPVLCLIQAWESGIQDYSDYWGIGHYVVAIGYDAERIYLMDPWMLGNYAYIPKKEFISRWHQLTYDNIHLNQWGMALSKGKSNYDPEAILYAP